MLRCEAIGRLTSDPELKQVNINNEQVSVCELSIAVNIGYGDNQKVEYIDCTAWRGLGETMGKYLQKGRKVYVAGKQQTRKFDVEKEGVSFNVRRVSWVLDEFEFCDSNSDQSNESQPQQQSKPAEKPYAGASKGREAAF